MTQRARISSLQGIGRHGKDSRGGGCGSVLGRLQFSICRLENVPVVLCSTPFCDSNTFRLLLRHWLSKPSVETVHEYSAQRSQVVQSSQSDKERSSSSGPGIRVVGHDCWSTWCRLQQRLASYYWSRADAKAGKALCRVADTGSLHQQDMLPLPRSTRTVEHTCIHVLPNNEHGEEFFKNIKECIPLPTCGQI